MLSSLRRKLNLFFFFLHVTIMTLAGCFLMVVRQMAFFFLKSNILSNLDQVSIHSMH